MKIVINKCYGGFGVTDAAMNHMGLPVPPDPPQWMANIHYLDNEDFDITSNNSLAYRADPRLVKAVEELGAAASASLSSLEVVEIPDGTNWTIEEYDGNEWVAEAHQVWG